MLKCIHWPHCIDCWICFVGFENKSGWYFMGKYAD